MKPTISAVAAALMIAITGPAPAEIPAPYPGTKIIKTSIAYGKLIKRLDKAVKANKMGLVTRASATMGARSLGIEIPGNMVIGVFAPKFAVRMLKASVAAGIEAPLRFYITEQPSGKSTLTYRLPSSTFAPYGSKDLDKMARELDRIFARIVKQTLGTR